MAEEVIWIRPISWTGLHWWCKSIDMCCYFSITPRIPQVYFNQFIKYCFLTSIQFFSQKLKGLFACSLLVEYSSPDNFAAIPSSPSYSILMLSMFVPWANSRRRWTMDCVNWSNVKHLTLFPSMQLRQRWMYANEDMKRPSRLFLRSSMFVWEALAFFTTLKAIRIVVWLIASENPCCRKL